MERSQATALVALLEMAFGQELEPSRAELYRQELVALQCFICAEAGTREAIRSVRFLPRIAEILDAYRTAVRDGHQDHAAPALTAEATWTEEERRQAQQVGSRVLRSFLDRAEEASSEPRIDPVEETRRPTLAELERELTPAAVALREKARRDAEALAATDREEVSA